MTRINTNVSSIVAQNRLQSNNNDLNSALTRLSTGLRINSGADDPAGLIASEALRGEISGLSKSISNTNRASQIISTADSALGQVSNLLNDVRGLVVEASNTGGLSSEEIDANQLQIDSSLEAINRIAQTTTFQGRRLLDGSLDFESNASSVASLSDFSIDQASLGSTGEINAEVVISAAAEQAGIAAGASAFSASANATASTASVGTATQTINTQDINITGEGLESIVIVDDDSASGPGTVSFDATSGALTITGNFSGTAGAGPPATFAADADAQVIQDAINDLDGFVAEGAAAAGTAGTAPTAGTVTADVNALTVTAANAGSEFNDVAINFVSGGTNEASFDADQNILTVTVDGSEPQSAADIATAIEAVVDDNGDAIFSATAATDASVDINDGIDSLDTGKTGGEVLNGDVVFQLTGSDGAETFNFAAGTSSDQIAAAVNLVSDSTGVSATNETGGLSFNSSDFGSNASVAIEVISEGAGSSFQAAFGSALTDTGADITATVNGIQANGDGNSFSINTSSLDLSLTVEDGSSTNFSFDITGGGAKFQLGPDVVSNQQANLGIGSVSTGQLGGSAGRLYELGSGQAKSLTEDAAGAAEIIDQVIARVTGIRGRLGAFQATTLDSNLNSLTETQANLLDAESSIRDADFAQESANLTRAQILVQSGTNVLSLANQNPQNVLALLG